MATNIVTNPKRARYLSDSDKQALKDLANGTWSQNAKRFAGNYLGGGGGLGALTATIGGGYLLGGQEGAGTAGFAKTIAAPLTGHFLRRSYNRSVGNQAQRVRDQILSRSAEAAARGVQPPQAPPSSLPYGIFPAYLSKQGQQ